MVTKIRRGGSGTSKYIADGSGDKAVLTDFPAWIMLRVLKKRTCVVVAYRIGVPPGSKECSRVLAANCNDIFIPDVDSVDFHIRLPVHSPSMEEHIIEING